MNVQGKKKSQHNGDKNKKEKRNKPKQPKVVKQHFVLTSGKQQPNVCMTGVSNRTYVIGASVIADVAKFAANLVSDMYMIDSTVFTSSMDPVMCHYYLMSAFLNYLRKNNSLGGLAANPAVLPEFNPTYNIPSSFAKFMQCFGTYKDKLTKTTITPRYVIDSIPDTATYGLVSGVDSTHIFGYGTYSLNYAVEASGDLDYATAVGTSVRTFLSLQGSFPLISACFSNHYRVVPFQHISLRANSAELYATKFDETYRRGYSSMYPIDIELCEMFLTAITGSSGNSTGSVYTYGIPYIANSNSIPTKDLMQRSMIYHFRDLKYDPKLTIKHLLRKIGIRSLCPVFYRFDCSRWNDYLAQVSQSLLLNSDDDLFAFTCYSSAIMFSSLSHFAYIGTWSTNVASSTFFVDPNNASYPLHPVLAMYSHFMSPGIVNGVAHFPAFTSNLDNGSFFDSATGFSTDLTRTLNTGNFRTSSVSDPVVDSITFNGTWLTNYQAVGTKITFLCALLPRFANAMGALSTSQTWVASNVKDEFSLASICSVVYSSTTPSTGYFGKLYKLESFFSPFHMTSKDVALAMWLGINSDIVDNSAFYPIILTPATNFTATSSFIRSMSGIAWENYIAETHGKTTVDSICSYFMRLIEGFGESYCTSKRPVGDVIKILTTQRAMLEKNTSKSIVSSLFEYATDEVVQGYVEGLSNVLGLGIPHDLIKSGLNSEELGKLVEHVSLKLNGKKTPDNRNDNSLFYQEKVDHSLF